MPGKKQILVNPRGKTPLILLGLLLSLALLGGALTSTAHCMGPEEAEARGLGLIAAGLAIGLSALGAGIAIYGGASASPAAVVERPEVAVWTLIYLGLGEGLAIYGLIVAIMILGKL